GGGNPELRSEASTQSMHSIIISPKSAYDSICVLLRYRNDAHAKTKCTWLLDTYPDSMQSINAIGKLFLAVSASDTSQAAMTSLKTYYETLILNHSGNVALVKRCNYFVQKCKVRLHQYTSAMSGFQQIINENPYSYEGLIARWDYMATSLLMNGQGGGERDNSNLQNQLSDDDLALFDDDPNDKSPLTREQRHDIRKAVNDALITTRDYAEKRIEIITQEAANGNEIAKEEIA